MAPGGGKRGLGIAGAILLVALLPQVLSTPYWRGILIVCSMNVMLALSLNLILGYTGQLNLGQSGFFAVGAYVSTILVRTYGWNFWLALVAALGTTGVLGMLLALFAVRLRGHYLGIASLGFAVIAYQAIVNWESMTEGVRGIYGIMPPPPIRIPGLPEVAFSNQANLFYLVAGIALLVYILLDNSVLRSGKHCGRSAKMKSRRHLSA
jgi:branched-chain amino acid transport system permease protein